MSGGGTLGLAAALVLQLAVVTAATAVEAPSVSRHVLANGIRVLVREDPSAGVVAVSVQVPGGSRFERAETAGITRFLQRMLLRGTPRHSARTLAEAVEDIGGTLETGADVDQAEVRATALARHWEALLGLVAEVVLAPTLPDEEVERERRLLLSQIRTRAETPFPLALEHLLADLYGPHPYGLPPGGRTASVERVSRDDLLRHYRRLYRPDRLVVAVSGGVEDRRVLRVVERLFGKLAGADAARVPDTPPPAPTGGRRTLDRPAQQAQILVGYLAPGVGDAEYAATKVLGAVLGGGMSGRLFIDVRERHGLAYSVGVVTSSRPGPGFFLAYAGTAPGSATEAEAALLRELERARSDGVSDAELARAKAYVLGNFAMDRRTNARHAWCLAFFEVVGAGWDFPERYVRAVDAVTAAAVRAAAAHYLLQPTVVILRPTP